MQFIFPSEVDAFYLDEEVDAFMSFLEMSFIFRQRDWTAWASERPPGSHLHQKKTFLMIIILSLE